MFALYVGWRALVSHFFTLQSTGGKVVLEHVASVLVAIDESAGVFGALQRTTHAKVAHGLALNFSHDLLGDIGGIVVTTSIADCAPESVGQLILEGSRAL